MNYVIICDDQCAVIICIQLDLLHFEVAHGVVRHFNLPAFKKCNVDERRIEINELKAENFQSEAIFIFSLCSWIFWKIKWYYYFKKV